MEWTIEEEELQSFNETDDTQTSFSEPFSLKVSLSVIYGVIFVTGILGNITTCIVIRRNRNMHTATNFYLFNLAISDLLLLICVLPREVYRLWNPFLYPFPEKICSALRFISQTSVNTTALTIAAFTVERYIVICQHLKSHKMSQLTSAVGYIIVIWVCALCSAWPQAMLSNIILYDEHGHVVSACTVKAYGVQKGFVIFNLMIFLLTVSLITVLYVLIISKLQTSHVLHPAKKFSFESEDRSDVTPRCRSSSSQSQVKSSQNQVIRMLVAVALSFFLCCAPFHVLRLIGIYGNNLKHPTNTFYHQVYVVLTSLSGVLYFLSTSINPFLYSIMSYKFREAFKVTLWSWCTRKDRSRLKRTYSSLPAKRKEPAAAKPSRRQQCVAPPQEQSFKRRKLTTIIEESDSWLERQRLAEGSDSTTSPQSISNSSLRELDQELIDYTSLYHMNCKILEETRDTSV